jgi:hypothetical protein
VKREIEETDEIQQIPAGNPPRPSNLAFTDVWAGPPLEQISQGNTSLIDRSVTL